MIPAVYDLHIHRGSTWSELWTRSGVTSAAGWSAAIDIREAVSESSTRYLHLESPSDGITLSSNGSVLTIAVTISSTQTALLPHAAYYDLKLTKPDGTVEYLLRGEVQTDKRVTL